MNRIGKSAMLAATLVACTADIGPTNQARIRLFPVLDSMFVGDGLPPRQVTYYDVQGNVQDPGTVQWLSSDTTVLTVDSSGRVRGRAAGAALVLARAQGIQGSALIAVSGPLQVTLLQNSVLLMPGDTFTMPVQVNQQAPGTPTVWFTVPTQAVVSIDSASGRDSAIGAGGPIPFVVHAALGTDTTTDSGTVEVLQLTDTVGGKASYQMFGTVNRDRTVSARALNFHRRGDTLTFRLRAAVVQNGTTVELVAVTLRTAPTAPGAFPIDSISPEEALGGQFDPFCRPPRNWGLWSVLTSQSSLQAVSRDGGNITITQVAPVSNGMAISGRFYLPAQRVDLYDEPLALVPIRGTFVAPLITTTPRCE
jgi:hypothetical protein